MQAEGLGKKIDKVSLETYKLSTVFTIALESKLKNKVQNNDRKNTSDECRNFFEMRKGSQDVLQ